MLVSMERPTASLVSRRRRRPVQKSFLGCAQCKARKIKCDEARPSCSRCIEKGIICAGVSTQPRIRWSKKYEVYQPKQVSTLRHFGAPQSIVPERSTLVSTGAATCSSSSDGRAININAQDLGVRSPTYDIADQIIPERHWNMSHPWDLQERPVEDVAADIPQEMDTSHGVEYCLLSPQTRFAPSSEVYTQRHLPVSLVDIPSKLVGVYFDIVCRIFSTFDSEQNLFRSFVSQRWQHSISMYYAMLSMAAAKLTREVPSLRVRALEYQSTALQSLYTDVSRASSWNTELLFVVLMLGLSTSWHDTTDLGIIHLKAMQRAMLDNGVERSCEFRTLNFFKEALVYWEMVICSVNDEVCVHDYLDDRSVNGSDSPAYIPRIMPHPWTGVALAPQALFAKIAQNIRQVRPFRHDMGTSGSTMWRPPEELLVSLNTLEEQLWLLELPQLHEIACTGDSNTPAIHHLLLAEAYMFASFYQLYYIFPRRRRKRAKSLTENADAERLPDRSWAQCQVRPWSSILQLEGMEAWLEFLGRNVITRLEQIPATSGTSCIQPLLLLVGSGSLSVAPELVGSGEEEEILRTRQFVLDRLSCISDLILSEPIHQVNLVAKEIFKRLDVGVDVFWMDVMHSMGVVTIIG